MLVFANQHDYGLFYIADEGSNARPTKDTADVGKIKLMMEKLQTPTFGPIGNEKDNGVPKMEKPSDTAPTTIKYFMEKPATKVNSIVNTWHLIPGHPLAKIPLFGSYRTKFSHMSPAKRKNAWNVRKGSYAVGSAVR